MIFALASRPSSEFISCCISAWEVKRSRCSGAAVRRCGGAAVLSQVARGRPGGSSGVCHMGQQSSPQARYASIEAGPCWSGSAGRQRGALCESWSGQGRRAAGSTVSSLRRCHLLLEGRRVVEELCHLRVVSHRLLQHRVPLEARRQARHVHALAAWMAKGGDIGRQ